MTKGASLKAWLPRGFADRGAADLAGMRAMLDSIRETFRLYGFEALETPFVEYTDALGKFLPDLDRPNEGVFSFQDDDEQWLSLRYDLTAPLARHVAERLEAQSLPLPYRSFREGWVFRNEKPGPGRFRQFMQFDADIVGAGSVAADAEACMLMADTLERVGIPRGQYVVKVNNRKVLDGILELAELGAQDGARRLAVLRALDKFDRLGLDGVIQLLGPGRTDESGAYTRGAGLDPRAIDLILNCTGWREADTGDRSSVSSGLTIDNLASSIVGSQRGEAGVEELKGIWQLVDAAGFGDGRILIDPSVVRGLEYYTGPVFEAELTFPVVNEDGETVRFGSVAGGGRYDGLVGRFRPEPVPATGFSIGVSRLHAALKIVGSNVVAATTPVGPVVVLVLDRDRIADYQAMVSDLRAANIAAELYLGSAGMKAQMKYADRRGAPCVVIQGSQERDAGVVQIKDLAEGASRARTDAAAATNADYRSARLAQVSVPRGDLVSAVKDIVDRPRM